jgi:hypothetical protein
MDNLFCDWRRGKEFPRRPDRQRADPHGRQKSPASDSLTAFMAFFSGIFCHCILLKRFSSFYKSIFFFIREVHLIPFPVVFGSAFGYRFFCAPAKKYTAVNNGSQTHRQGAHFIVNLRKAELCFTMPWILQLRSELRG